MKRRTTLFASIIGIVVLTAGAALSAMDFGATRDALLASKVQSVLTAFVAPSSGCCTSAYRRGGDDPGDKSGAGGGRGGGDGRHRPRARALHGPDEIGV